MRRVIGFFHPTVSFHVSFFFSVRRRSDDRKKMQPPPPLPPPLEFATEALEHGHHEALQLAGEALLEDRGEKGSEGRKK